MATRKQDIQAGELPDSVKDIVPKDADYDSTMIEDTIVFYRKWFDCLLAQGERNFQKAIIAFFYCVFYGEDIRSFHLPRRLESILETFLPIVETNKRRRNGGKKGASAGIMGGRPIQNTTFKTPKGLSSETPKVAALGINGSASNVNGNVNKNIKDNANVSVNGEVETPATPTETIHLDYSFFIPVFFFRNLKKPAKQAEKFFNHYEATGWKLGGGDYMATVEQRVAAARQWEVRDDTATKYQPEDLSMWHELYQIAPPEIQKEMVNEKIIFHRTEKDAIIKGPAIVSEWIEGNIEKTKPIVTKWMAGRRYSYYPL